jgi:hypothetical protein
MTTFVVIFSIMNAAAPAVLLFLCRKRRGDDAVTDGLRWPFFWAAIVVLVILDGVIAFVHHLVAR